MVLIVWDRLFGTFQKEMLKEKVIYGITKPPENDGLMETIFHEFKNIKSDISRSSKINEKLKYIFYAPGWSHDGSTQTTKEMRQEMNH
jgi:hypothetical protein